MFIALGVVMPQNEVPGRSHSSLAGNYGSRSGFARTVWFRLLDNLGAYREYHHVDWKSVERLVFVCKGNICRSAYAEAVARSLGIAAVSCGLNAIDGAPADEVAVNSARKRGYSLDSHRTTPVLRLDLNSSDLLVAMEPWQTKALKNILGRDHPSTLLGLWCDPVLPHIQDPFGTPAEYFNKCFENIEKSVHEIEKKIKQAGD